MKKTTPAVLAMTGASAAVCISDIPFEGPIGAVKVGRINGEYVINPTYEQLDESDINIIVSGNKESIISVEGECHEAPDADVLGALRAGQEAIARLVELQEDLVARCGKPKREVVAPEPDEALEEAVRAHAAERIREANRLSEKEDRSNVIAQIEADTQEALETEYPESRAEIAAEIAAIVKAEMRRMILEEGRRIDGRALDEVRPVQIELGVLPRAHGSAVFTRGQTQALCVATLGSKLDTRMVDDLEGMSYKSFMLDYNFPSYSVGRPAGSAHPDGARSDTASSRKRRWFRSCPMRSTFPIRFGSFPKSWNRTVRRPWPRCAADRSHSWTREYPLRPRLRARVSVW